MTHRATLGDVWHALVAFGNDADATTEIGRLAPSRNTVRKAIVQLQAVGKTSTILEAYATQNGWSFERPNRRPVLNDTRLYAVMQQAAGGPFVRIPVSALNLSTGDQVRASFLNGRITLDPVKKAQR